MPPRLYKRHCSTCGISHTKPTGRKCTRVYDGNGYQCLGHVNDHWRPRAQLRQHVLILGVSHLGSAHRRGVPSVLNHATTKFGNPNINHDFPDVFIIFPPDAITTRPFVVHSTLPPAGSTDVDSHQHPTALPSPHPNASTQRWPVGASLHPASRHFHAGPDIPPNDQHGKQGSSASGLPSWVPTSSNIRADSRGRHWRATCASWSLRRSGRRIGARAAAATGDGMQQWFRGRKGRHHNTTQ